MFKCPQLNNIASTDHLTYVPNVSIQLIIVLISLILLSQTSEAQNNDYFNDDFLVVIDPGHGGEDSGTRGGGYREKKVVLNVSLQVAEQLKSISGIKGILTRKTDKFIPLHERANIANKANADLFLSIHCNAAGSKSAYGAETFVLGLHRNDDNFEIAKKENQVILMEDDYKKKYDGFNPKSPESYMTFTMMQEEYLDESILLADKVQKRFVSSLKRYDRGVKQAGFLVLRETTMPSILIEMGFLSNPKEGKYLNSKKGQKQMAKSIVKAIQTYKNAIDRTSSNNETELSKRQSVKVDRNEDDKGFTFKVQLAASSNEIEPSSQNFKGLSPITRSVEGDFFKYYYGNASNYFDAQELVKYARGKGYKTAFLVAFTKSGDKISLAKAIDSAND
jgi:N-acetylmuramoyl-L-alanine amidase